VLLVIREGWRGRSQEKSKLVRCQRGSKDRQFNSVCNPVEEMTKEDARGIALTVLYASKFPVIQASLHHCSGQKQAIKDSPFMERSKLKLSPDFSLAFFSSFPHSLPSLISLVFRYPQTIAVKCYFKPAREPNNLPVALDTMSVLLGRWVPLWRKRDDTSSKIQAHCSIYFFPPVQRISQPHPNSSTNQSPKV
jgi:hypothetical protein